MVPLLRDLAAEFEAQHEGVIVVVEGGNTYQGVARVLQAEVDLGACTLLPPDDLWSAPLALDAIALIVHPDNPVGDLTLAQVRELFGGRISTWRQVGVAWDREVTAVSREEGSGVRLNFEGVAMPSQRAANGACRPAIEVDDRPARVRLSPCPVGPVTSTAVVMPGSAAVVDYVSAHPGAIGYVSQGALSTQVKAIRVEGVEPTSDAIEEGGYPFVQPFFLVASREPVGTARQFADFALGPVGQALVRRRYRPVR
jgi:phosphate transport system substrate-binding protein